MKTKLIGLLGILLTMNLLASCGSNGSDTPNGVVTQIAPGLINHLDNFSPAAVVIGQKTLNEGGWDESGWESNPPLLPTASTFGNWWGMRGSPTVLNSTLYVSDYSNHRILGFNAIPTASGRNADFVLGQPDFVTNTPGTAADKLGYPDTVKSYDGKLFVVDHLNSRILIWNTQPTKNQSPADVVVGQPGFGSSDLATTQTGLRYPDGMEVAAGKLIVADKHNNRVLVWNSIPTTNGAPADLVLGQGDFTHNVSNDDNQDGIPDGGTPDGTPTARTLFEPYSVWSDGKQLIVVDMGNNRVLIWKKFPTVNFQPADIVIGQSDFTHMAFNDDNQDGVTDGPSARVFYYPTNISSNGTQLFITDCNNSRVLVWDRIPKTNFAPADTVIGQKDFIHSTPNDANHDGIEDAGPTAQTLSYPSSSYVYGNKLLVQDQGNKRYLIYDLH